MFPATITITIAPGQDRVLNRVNQDAHGSEYSFNSGTEGIVMKIRHTTDTVDGDGLTMKRHNVFFERIVYPTATDLMQKQTFTSTLRHDRFNDPAIVARIALGVGAWLANGTNAADLAAGIN